MKSKTDKMGFPPGTALNLLVGVSIIFFIQPCRQENSLLLLAVEYLFLKSFI
jgi:hypothetical protein